MNYIKLTKYDIANGPGIRSVLWVSGCSHHCRGCHNPDTWNPKVGKPYNVYLRSEILNSLEPDYISGLTLSGGDPLYHSNLKGIRDLVTYVKKHLPNKSIWLYTGYTYEAILDEIACGQSIYKDILDHIDVLVDGRYEHLLRDISLPYCGSSNQRVIDIRRSHDEGKVVLYE